jgi:hypothetical protein
MAIGVNWKEVWKAVWKPVWAQSFTTAKSSSGDLLAQSATVDGTGAIHPLHQTSGALQSQSATVDGSASLVRVHTSSGALQADPATIAGAAVDETSAANYIAPSGAAGKPKKTRKRRLQLEIDGEVIEVNSIQEAEAILEDIRVKAEEKARVAVSRATKVKRKEVRDVIRDARKTLQVPEITAPPDLRDYASQMIGQIRAEYGSALKSIEIGVLIARQEAEIEQDDEEILMLL